MTEWRFIVTGFILSAIFFLSPSLLQADYEQEIRGQIEQLGRRYPADLDLNYFHDMGIIARKSDEAGLNNLTTEIVGSLLLKRMDQYVENQLDLIHRLFRTDPVKASRQLVQLNRLDRYYEPTDEYLSTTGGQALSSEVAMFRQQVVEDITRGCSLRIIKEALQALRKTGLMMTNRTEEIKNSRTLINELECCLNWKSEIHYYFEEPFATEYEAGTISEEGRLKIQTTPRDYTRARWVGEWIYRFQGREGKAEGVSRATLTYEKGDQPAEMAITAARMSSAGRINLPIMLAGDFRYLEVEGSRLYPVAMMPGQDEIKLVGCRDDETT